MVFSDADFTAGDFALAGLVFARGLFVFAAEVFFLGALGSVALEVVAALSSFMAAILASFSASSLSVLRLTLDQDQATSLVEQTMVLSLRLWARSLIQPEGPQASITTSSAG